MREGGNLAESRKAPRACMVTCKFSRHALCNAVQRCTWNAGMQAHSCCISTRVKMPQYFQYKYMYTTRKVVEFLENDIAIPQPGEWPAQIIHMASSSEKTAVNPTIVISAGRSTAQKMHIYDKPRVSLI